MLVFLIISMSVGSSIGIEKVSNQIENKNSEGSITRYVYGSSLIASIKGGDITYYHSDRINSNRIITDSDGLIESEFNSLPFGQEIKNSGIKFSFATGKELDESKLYYFGARYYLPNLGRFTSVDPVKENEAYSYVRNNPLKFIDPSGTTSIWLYSGGDRRSADYLIESLSAQGNKLEIGNYRYDLGSDTKTTIRFFSGHHDQMDPVYHSDYTDEYDLTDLEVSKDTKVSFYMACNSVIHPKYAERPEIEVINTMLTKGPHSVHLGYSTKAPSTKKSSVGSPELIKNFLKLTGEGFTEFSSKNLASLWVQAGIETYGPKGSEKSTVGAYYKEGNDWYYMNAYNLEGAKFNIE